MTASSPAQAVANGRAVTGYPVGYCQKYVRDPCWRVPSLYGSAIDAWNGARRRHPGDRNPPAGAPCYYSGGNYGHAVISVGGGRIRSTDCPTSGRVNDTDLAWPERTWGYTYLGWTEDLNGVTLPGLDPTPPPPPEDPMPDTVNVHARGDQVLAAGEWTRVKLADPASDVAHLVHGNLIDLGGRPYVSTAVVTVDANGRGQARTRLVELEKNGDDWTPSRELPAVYHATAHLGDTRSARAGDDTRTRLEVMLPDGGAVVSATWTLLRF